MIKFILTVVKMLIAILPFVLLCIRSRKVNLDKPERSKQFPMVIVTLVYVIIAMLLMNTVSGWLISLLQAIPKWIGALAQFSWMPAFLQSIFATVSSFISSLLAGLNLNFWICFLANAAMILVYLIIKRISLKIIKKAVKTDGALYTKVASTFYEYFSERNAWCIRENYVQTRSLLKVFYYGAVVLSCLLMMVSRRFYFHGLMEAVFYPVFGILVVGELYFYLDGLTRKEYTNNVLGEDEDAYRTVNYSLLRKFLRSIFGDKLLSENTSINNSLTYDITTEDIIQELENSEDPKVVSFASYMDALNKTGFTVDHNYLRSSLDMLNGKSILFNNPFYNDLIPYAFYPMNRTLLSHQKVLVVLGRHAIEEDVKEWIENGIEAVTNIPFLWNVGILTAGEQPNLDIGIVTRSAVLDIDLHNANADFLEQVGFVVVIEPSKLISTAQIGLNLLVKKCRDKEDKNIVYCLCDKNCDGLVDAMSHVLMTSITEVSATKKHLGTSSYMCWEADDDYLHHRLVPNISRYLGLGTELSFAALKNQVSKTTWYGGEAFPVTDMRWIDNQYYYDLTKYANLPTSQEAMDESFVTSPNFWSARAEKNSYMTVEDESFNMFEILRDFSTRATEQGFINVISSEYLLKDYMADNASIFEADAKAIPFIVSDFTRSHRNTILRLVLMMSSYPVQVEMLEKELSLLGIPVYSLKKQLWYELYRCYTSVDEIAALPEDYKEAVESVYEKPIEPEKGQQWYHQIIEIRESFNLKSGKMETTYSITDIKFLKACVTQLRSAGYVAEDEKGQRYYLGAELAGHIYHKYLPGQFFTFGGKYYEMQYLTADGQVLVRRAADHINGRPSYRQIREYIIHGVKASDQIGAMQDVAGMKIVKEFADISVKTPGYYRMKKYNDFSTAQKIAFEGEKNGIPVRTYCNKEILRIDLPDFDGKLTDTVRYTITLLFNEVFKTIFAENQAYISAVTDESFLEQSENQEVRPLTYSIIGDGYELHPNSIYIIEDSQLDLGLTVAVERNLERIFSIVFDYLDWHMETLEASLNPPADPQPPVVFNQPQEGEGENGEEDGKKKKRGFFGRIWDAIKNFFKKIGGWFKRKPKGEEPAPENLPVDGEAETPVEPTGEEGAEQPTDVETPTEEGTEGEPPTDDQNGEEQPVDGQPEEEQPAGEDTTPITPAEEPPAQPAGDLGVDEEQPVEDIPQENGMNPPAAEDEEGNPINSTGDEDDSNIGVGKEPTDTAEFPAENETVFVAEEDTVERGGFSTERLPYHLRYYLLYGKTQEPVCIDLSATKSYLSQLGLQKNPLKQARDGKKIAEFVEATFKPGKPDARYCDFCGTEIFGVEFETLADGRDRCLQCGRTAIKTEKEFRKLFEDVKRNMESFFGIRIQAGIRVEMVNSKKLHKRLGQAFIPTPQSDGRVLGVAISDKSGYTLMVENGSPRMATMLTMAHELTHIWQYINWNDKAITKKYGSDMRLEIYEGMAKWVEIQYAYLINEPSLAKREEIITSYRDDEYGHGFLRYRANYPFSLGTVITKPTPFMNLETPLDPQFCGAITVTMPTDGVNPGDLPGNDEPSGGNTPGITPGGSIPGPIERDPKGFARYAYGLLTGEEQLVYNQLLQAVMEFAPVAEGFESRVTDDQIQKIIDYVQRDHPEIFWFQHGATFYFDTETHIVTKVEFTYCMSKEEAAKRQEKIDVATKSFLAQVTDDMSDYEATLHIYENIIQLVDYDTIGLERQKKTEVSANEPDDLRSIYGVFVNKKAVCAGYAKAMQYLLNLCGIECTYVTSKTHAWNLVKLEGDYYHMDVTWGDGSDTKKDKNQTSAINYDCFCLTTAEVLKLDSHLPEEGFPVPECTATGCNYHHRHGLFMETYSFDTVRSVVSESAKANKLEISFKFGSAEEFNRAKRDLIDGGKFREAMQYAGLKAGIKLSSAFSYATRDEIFTMALTMLKA